MFEDYQHYCLSVAAHSGFLAYSKIFWHPTDFEGRRPELELQFYKNFFDFCKKEIGYNFSSIRFSYKMKSLYFWKYCFEETYQVFHFSNIVFSKHTKCLIFEILFSENISRLAFWK